MRKIALASVLTLMATLSVAGPVDSERAARAARTFWMSRTGAADATLLTDRTAEWPYGGMYLFTHPDGGFVLVSADDAARPILGYSLTTAMPVDGLPENLAGWLRGYESQMAAMPVDAVASPRNAELWKQLDKGTLPAARKEGVGPLITSMWNQEAPYNEMCPGEGNNRCATGCVATATAMVMKYWNHPRFGVGSHSYEEHEYGTLTADFAHTLYDWEMMFDLPNAYSIPEARHAIAELMFHVGVAVEMYYRTAAGGGSGAVGVTEQEGAASTNNALMRYFHYSPSMRVARKANFTSDESWRDTLVAELRKLHPIPYDGSDERGGGHAFVCDGFDDDLLLHFNFGWSGSGNGYYAVNDITPHISGVGGNSTGTFNQDNVALLGVEPDRNPLVNQSQIYYSREAASDTLWVAFDDTLTAWTATSEDDWLTVEHADFSDMGDLAIRLTENTSGAERTGTITVRQGALQSVVKVVQEYFSEEDRCPVTVTMVNRGPSIWGWRNGAYLSVESTGGKVFARCQMNSGDGNEKEQTVMVDPKDVHFVWHSGGSTDNLAGYSVRNQHGELLINVEDASLEEEPRLVMWPCAYVGIDAAEADPAPVLYPNPTSGHLQIAAEGDIAVLITDITGRAVMESQSKQLDLGPLADGIYFVRTRTSQGVQVNKIVKRGNQQ